MTEQDWLSSLEPEAMFVGLYYQGITLNERKFRLFACACCRQFWETITDPRSRNAVEVAEQFADELVSDEELRDAWNDAWAALPAATSILAKAAVRAARDTARDRVSHAGYAVAAQATEFVSEATIANILRDIVGNPFKPIASQPHWNSRTTLQLAQTMYDTRDFTAMPILGDALEEAGCDNDDILDHCRSGEIHVRGCWVVDQVLGKS